MTTLIDNAAVSSTNASAVSFELGVYEVKALKDLAKVELGTNEYLARKIEKGTGKESKGAIIKKLGADECLEFLGNSTIAESFIEWANGLREQKVKELISCEDGRTKIEEYELSLYSIATMLEAQEIKEGRVTKDKILAWFDNELARKLKEAITAKFGAVDNDKMLGILKNNRAAMATLAKRENSLSDNVVDSLKKLVAMSENAAMVEFANKKLEESRPKSLEEFGL